MVSTIRSKFVRAALCAALVVPLVAAAEGPRLQTAPINAQDLASLQNGAKLFVNYCLNCHNAGYMRYNRLEDLGQERVQVTQFDLRETLDAILAGKPVPHPRTKALGCAITRKK